MGDLYWTFCNDAVPSLYAVPAVSPNNYQENVHASLEVGGGGVYPPPCAIEQLTQLSMQMRHRMNAAAVFDLNEGHHELRGMKSTMSLRVVAARLYCCVTSLLRNVSKQSKLLWLGW